MKQKSVDMKGGVDPTDWGTNSRQLLVHTHLGREGAHTFTLSKTFRTVIRKTKGWEVSLVKITFEMT